MPPEDIPENEGQPTIDSSEGPASHEPKNDLLKEEKDKLLGISESLSSNLNELASDNPDIDLGHERNQLDQLRGDLGSLIGSLVENSSDQSQEVDRTEGNFMRKVKEKYKEQLDGYEIIPIDENGVNLGYILRNKVMPPIKGDWVITDLDDTMIGTQEVKPQREQLFSEYFKNLGMDLSDEQVANIINATDKFARWQETSDGSKDYYHPIAHMAAMQQVTDALLDAKHNNDASSVEDVVAKVFEKFDRIKSQLSDNSQSENEDPFRFDENKKIVLKKTPPWSNDIAIIFKQTMVAPPRYEKNIDAFSGNGLADNESTDGQVYKINKGLFTSGVPSYQLNKIGELLKEHPDLRFNSMLFTRVGKDKFLRHFIETEGIRDSVIVMYDDGIDNIEGIEQMGKEMHELTGNTIVGIVAKTPHSKDNGEVTDLQVLDYNNSSETDIRTGLKAALDTRSGENNSANQ